MNLQVTIRPRAVRAASLLVVVATVAGLAACGGREPPAARRLLRLTTGTPGARFHPLGQALARIYTESLPMTDVEVRDSAGSVANVEAIERGDADVGLAYADVAYMAYVGRLDERRGPFSELRGIAVLELAPVHFVVRAGSSIADASGLRGRRVAVGPTGSGSALTAGMVLAALGLGEGAVKVESLPYNDSAARIAAGTIDALFVTGSEPVDAVRAAALAGARILPLTGPAIEGLRHDYPFPRGGTRCPLERRWVLFPTSLVVFLGGAAN